jgi:hypothetical protein
LVSQFENSNQQKPKQKTPHGKMKPSQAVLIIGATGRTGSCLIQQLSTKPASCRPQIFAFCRDPSKLDQNVKELCHGVIQGNARSPTDLERAIQRSQADLVVVSIGNGDSVKKTDIRTESAEALVQVLCKRIYKHVHVLAVSSIGAGGSGIKAGFGIGNKLIEFHLRHVLKDQDGQEAAFLSAFKDRTMIVRPKALAEQVITFDSPEKCPTMQTYRKDLADCLEL